MKVRLTGLVRNAFPLFEYCWQFTRACFSDCLHNRFTSHSHCGQHFPTICCICGLFRTARPLVVFQLKAAPSLSGMCFWSSFVGLYDWDCCLFIRSLEVCVTQHSYAITTTVREGVTLLSVVSLTAWHFCLLSHCHVSCVLCWDALFAAVCKVLNFSFLACSAGSCVSDVFETLGKPLWIIVYLYPVGCDWLLVIYIWECESCS